MKTGTVRAALGPTFSLHPTFLRRTFRRTTFPRTTFLAVLVALTGLIASPALSQVAVTVQNESFAWTGKSGQQANYRWSATINNPSGGDVNVRVTIELLDDGGDVVGSDSAELAVAGMDRGTVERTASIAVSTAANAKQYRIVLTGLD